MLEHLRRSVILAVIATVLFGLVYPLIGVGFAQLFFHGQANGSIGKYGSSLIGQSWGSTLKTFQPEWFHGRPDADDPLVANGVAGESAAANLGPRSSVLASDTKAFVQLWQHFGVSDPTTDLVTTSASGLDPDITPQDALVQVAMVSKYQLKDKHKAVSPARLRALIRSQTQGAEWGFLGQSTVNVLALNEALAKLG
jgi:K+-transporting ATPase ATPase C chain